MAIINEKFSISTLGFGDIIDITQKVQGIVSGANVESALLNVCAISPCTSIITLEYEKGLNSDIISLLELLAPVNRLYNHDITWHDGNAFAHLRSALLAHNLTLPVMNKQIQLSNWQRIVLMDFDNKASVRDIVVSLNY